MDISIISRHANRVCINGRDIRRARTCLGAQRRRQRKVGAGSLARHGRAAAGVLLVPIIIIIIIIIIIGGARRED